jgi:hypothetical protein
LIGQWLSQRLGQQFIVESRPGMSGNLATEAVIRALPDGYTLANIAANNSWSSALYNLNFDFVRDLAPWTSVYAAPAIAPPGPSWLSALHDAQRITRRRPLRLGRSMANSGPEIRTIIGSHRQTDADAPYIFRPTPRSRNTSRPY